MELIPVDRTTGLLVPTIRSSRIGLFSSPDAIFHTSTPIRSSRSPACTENGELKKYKSRSCACVLRPSHWASVNSIRFQ